MEFTASSSVPRLPIRYTLSRELPKMARTEFQTKRAGLGPRFTTVFNNPTSFYLDSRHLIDMKEEGTSLCLGVPAVNLLLEFGP